MDVDPLVTLLVGAFGAALIALLGAWIQSRREHSRWIREQRLAAYLAYARETERILSGTKHVSPKDAQDATATLRLLGPQEVFDAAFAFTVSTLRHALVQSEPDANRDIEGPVFVELSEKREKFIEAARRELRIRG